MRRVVGAAAVGLVAALGAVGLIATAAARRPGPVFIDGNRPVTADEVVAKLRGEGLSDIQVTQRGRVIEAGGQKDGVTKKYVIDSQTGRLGGDDDDDD